MYKAVSRLNWASLKQCQNELFRHCDIWNLGLSENLGVSQASLSTLASVWVGPLSILTLPLFPFSGDPHCDDV